MPTEAAASAARNEPLKTPAAPEDGGDGEKCELILVGDEMEYSATGVRHSDEEEEYEEDDLSDDSSDSSGIEVLTEEQQRELDLRDLAETLEMNPYVEPVQDDDTFYNFDDATSSDEEGADRSASAAAAALEWENPSYLVKDLDTGESYRVEEIDQHYTLVTLDSVAAQHEAGYRSITTRSWSLSMFADLTSDIDMPQAGREAAGRGVDVVVPAFAVHGGRDSRH